VTDLAHPRLVRPRWETVAEPVLLDPADPQRPLEFLAWLRDTHTEATEVSWHAVAAPGVDATPLYHLPPPAGGADAFDQWRAAHRPGMCYYRVGPGFVQVKDVRQAETAARFLLDDAATVAAFTRCLRPGRLTDLAPDERAAAQLLVDERLLLRWGDWVMTLPSRMRRWPVPSESV